MCVCLCVCDNVCLWFFVFVIKKKRFVENFVTRAATCGNGLGLLVFSPQQSFVVFLSIAFHVVEPRQRIEFSK